MHRKQGISKHSTVERLSINPGETGNLIPELLSTFNHSFYSIYTFDTGLLQNLDRHTLLGKKTLKVGHDSCRVKNHKKFKLLFICQNDFSYSIFHFWVLYTHYTVMSHLKDTSYTWCLCETQLSAEDRSF